MPPSIPQAITPGIPLPFPRQHPALGTPPALTASPSVLQGHPAHTQTRRPSNPCPPGRDTACHQPLGQGHPFLAGPTWAALSPACASPSAAPAQGSPTFPLPARLGTQPRSTGCRDGRLCLCLWWPAGVRARAGTGREPVPTGRERAATGRDGRGESGYQRVGSRHGQAGQQRARSRHGWARNRQLRASDGRGQAGGDGQGAGGTGGQEGDNNGQGWPGMGKEQAAMGREQAWAAGSRHRWAESR